MLAIAYALLKAALVTLGCFAVIDAVRPSTKMGIKVGWGLLLAAVSLCLDL
ncbi:hypothetical protein FDI24_gp216 [Acidovorax phage ACP17]|uniref:Uncharacterized protein n=1 Tax=Acidovorax phage ACP17 TaxID=2010329 RepID=A0A218M377_9CAUD|nr:hypothetical protein FDI24_gp216 [Acidovorax phage ACP17]ASD50497.1 hypothetical protein [Acidovorax phage ACP17]